MVLDPSPPPLLQGHHKHSNSVLMYKIFFLYIFIFFPYPEKSGHRKCCGYLKKTTSIAAVFFYAQYFFLLWIFMFFSYTGKVDARSAEGTSRKPQAFPQYFRAHWRAVGSAPLSCYEGLCNRVFLVYCICIYIIYAYMHICIYVYEVPPFLATKVCALVYVLYIV